MISAEILAWMDHRLQLVKGNSLPFGGNSVYLKYTLYVLYYFTSESYLQQNKFPRHFDYILWRSMPIETCQGYGNLWKTLVPNSGQQFVGGCS